MPCLQTKLDTGHGSGEAVFMPQHLPTTLVCLRGASALGGIFFAISAKLYNHVTGEVVFAPAHGLRVDRLRLAPLDGVQLLAQIYASKEENNA